MDEEKKKFKIKLLLESREKTLKRLERVKERYREEKENEDAWPGHGGSALLSLESDYDMLEAHLRSIDKELEELGFKKEGDNGRKD